jgi:DNA-binding transcriptional ArsR family regulator
MGMDAALRAIAEPRRREILRLVWHEERTVSDIASHFDVTRPAISQHLRVLADAGLVTLRRDGRRSIYRAKRGAMQDLRTYLGAFWDVELAGLKVAAERAEREKGSHERRRRH